jgi:hypothetical protein
MHRGVVGELLGQVVPLATGAQSEDDSVQGGPLVDTPTSGALGRIALGEDRFDLLPQLVGHAPNGGKGLCLGIVLANRSLLSSGIVEMIADREGFEIVTKRGLPKISNVPHHQGNTFVDMVMAPKAMRPMVDRSKPPTRNKSEGSKAGPNKLSITAPTRRSTRPKKAIREANVPTNP